MTSRDRTLDGRLVVQLSLRPPDGSTQFVDLLLAGRPDDVEYRFFTWKAALTGHYDVFHVHWPELLIRDRRSPARAFLKRRLMDVLLLRLRLRGIPLVRTYHNPRPHELGRHGEQRTLDRVDRSTTLFIVLSKHVSPPGDRATVTIPHGHYAGAIEKLARPAAVPGRVLYFGIIRPYKNVEALTRAFAAIDSPARSLHIVGDPHPGQRASLEAAAVADPRLTLDLRFVDDETLVREVSEASLVVLPYVEMKNSGALLVAASLGRPALVPDSPINTELQDEFGHEWIRTYSGELTPEVLADALRATSEPTDSAPVLDGRDERAIGAQHVAAYRTAIDLARS